MMVLTSPSTNIRRDPVRARPHLKNQQPPGEIAEDADGAWELIACTVIYEVIHHRLFQTQGFGPPAPGKDDILGKTAERRLLVQPGCSHATAKLRASQRLLRQQPGTVADATQHVLLRPVGQ